MYNARFIALLEALRVFEGGKLSLTNLLMLVIAAYFVRYRDPDWTMLVGLGMILISYNYKRYLNARLEAVKISVENKNDDEMKKVTGQLRSIENQMAMNSRGF